MSRRLPGDPSEPDLGVLEVDRLGRRLSSALRLHPEQHENNYNWASPYERGYYAVSGYDKMPDYDVFHKLRRFHPLASNVLPFPPRHWGPLQIVLPPKNPRALVYSLLLKNLAYLLDYFRHASVFLFQHLHLHYRFFQIDSDGSPVLEVIEEKHKLATKWSDKICSLEKDSEIMHIFDTVWNFIEFESIVLFVDNLLRKYPFDGHPTTQNDGVSGAFISAILSDYHKEAAALVEYVPRSHNATVSTSPIHIPSFQSPDAMITFFFNSIKDIECLEPAWNVDPILCNMLKLRIEDTIVRQLHLLAKYEQNYEVAILRVIWDNESGSSPHSFNENECLILDITDMTIFHLDSIPTIIDIVCDQLSIVEEVPMQEMLKLFLEKTVEPLFASIIEEGTIGLSKWHTLTTIWKVLTNFYSLLSQIYQAIEKKPVTFKLKHYLETFEVFETEVARYVEGGLEELKGHMDVFSENEDHLRDAYFLVYCDYYNLKYKLALIKEKER